MSFTLSRRSVPWIIFVIALLVFGAFFVFRARPVTGVPGSSVNESASSTWKTGTEPTIVRSDSPSEGPFAAKAVFVEFLDYQCPACEAYQQVMRSLRADYAGRVRFVVRQFPITELHVYAKGAAIAATCAQKQGKFFEYSDALFADQEHLTKDDLVARAKGLQLNVDAFSKCLVDPVVADRVVQDRLEGNALGITGTPWFFLNGNVINGLPSLDEMKKMIDRELAH